MKLRTWGWHHLGLGWVLNPRKGNRQSGGPWRMEADVNSIYKPDWYSWATETSRAWNGLCQAPGGINCWCCDFEHLFSGMVQRSTSVALSHLVRGDLLQPLYPKYLVLLSHKTALVLYWTSGSFLVLWEVQCLDAEGIVEKFGRRAMSSFSFSVPRKDFAKFSRRNGCQVSAGLEMKHAGMSAVAIQVIPFMLCMLKSTWRK